MRPLRVSLVGTVILALLGGTGSVLLAQEDVNTVKVTPLMNHMIGHEAYEGLFAVSRGFYADGPGSDWVFDGLIVEGEMPPMPEALEPPAE